MSSSRRSTTHRKTRKHNHTPIPIGHDCKQSNLQTSCKFHVNVNQGKVLVLYTGGTIGMKEGPNGLRPSKGYIQTVIKSLLNIYPNHRKVISKYDIIEFDPLLDSANMEVSDWNRIIKAIGQHYKSYKSFVILHGTDTMAYSASAISFALKNLTKPVIFTGSQIPVSTTRSDGINNLLTSLILASNYNYPEVVINFRNGVFRGNRSVKVSSNMMNAFESPNFPFLAYFGYSVMPVFNEQAIKTKQSGNFAYSLYDETPTVYTYWLTPGCDFRQLKATIDVCPNIRAVILRTYGIGDGPVNNKHFVDVLNYLRDKEIIVLNVSQCLKGRINDHAYATGSILKKCKVISGRDMTFEAAYCKLLFLLSQTSNTNAIRRDIHRDMCGELSLHLTIKNFVSEL